MTDGTHAPVRSDDRVQTPQGVYLPGAGSTRSYDPPAGCTIEHQQGRTMMIVVLATEVEQVIECGGRDAALLHARQRVPGDDGFESVGHRCCASVIAPTLALLAFALQEHGQIRFLRHAERWGLMRRCEAVLHSTRGERCFLDR